MGGGGPEHNALHLVVGLHGRCIGAAAGLAGAGATSLGLTPGGLGVVELTLTAGLVAAGLDGLHALAEVLLSRLVSLWLATAAGWAALASLTAGGASRPSQQPVVPASRPAVAVSARP